MNQALTLIAMVSAAVVGAQPRLTNAKLETHAVNAPLEAEMRKLVNQPGPVWIGYSVPVAGEHRSCCYYSDGNLSFRGCALESGEFRGNGGVMQATAPVQLEAAKEVLVLFRAENNRVDKVRTFTPDCDLDAGGVTFYWLTGVKPAESVAYLRTLVNLTADTMNERERSRDSALNAIAMHSDPAAQAVLEAFLAPDQPEAVRRRVAYAMAWRGRTGYDVLTRIVKNDADERVREAAVRALPETKQPDAVSLITAVAKEDKNARVRGEALYALARVAGTRAASTIQAAMESDPDRQVRRRAVAAVNQLPPEQGIPMLIAIARTSKDSDVRREAMQLLGRSHDDRAHRFIEELLSK